MATNGRTASAIHSDRRGRAQDSSEAVSSEPEEVARIDSSTTRSPATTVLLAAVALTRWTARRSAQPWNRSRWTTYMPVAVFVSMKSGNPGTRITTVTHTTNRSPGDSTGW